MLRVRAVVENDPLWTYDEIEAKTTLSRGAIEEIINEDINEKKMKNS